MENTEKRKLRGLFESPNVVEKSTEKRLKLADMQYARRKEESLLKTVLEKCTTRKRSLGRPRPRWDDGVTEDVKKIKPRVDWKEILLDREKWKKTCWTAYGLKSCSYERIIKRRRLLRYAILYVCESPTNEIKNKHYFQKSK